MLKLVLFYTVHKLLLYTILMSLMLLGQSSSDRELIMIFQTWCICEWLHPNVFHTFLKELFTVPIDIIENNYLVLYNILRHMTLAFLSFT